MNSCQKDKPRAPDGRSINFVDKPQCPTGRVKMAIDADKLDQEADAEYARLMGMEPQAPVSQQEQD
ncbi:hypothetical protein, partial [Endozoicomonas atrinae]|uniref:hypothetical protein n=1 Tax=Endozoicomonas atrinae TaxID=1333660 RepID=UPI001EE769F9